LTTDVGTQYNPTDCVTDPVPGTSVQTIATNDSGSSDSENSDHLDCNKVHSSDYTATSSEDDTDITVSDTEEMCTSPVDQQKFIVFSNNLDELFHFCSKCGSPITHTSKYTKGTMVCIKWTCLSNCSGTWCSQPLERLMPLGNLLVAGAILFSGGQYQKFADFSRLLNLAMISESTFYDIQDSYLFPVVEEEYSLQQTAILGVLNGESVYVMGDGQCDSPGHNAKYLAYTLMEEETDLILASTIVCVNEVANSNAMEKEGLHRCLEILEDHHLDVTGLATDRHPQITKYMRTERPNTEHQYEIYHTAKGVVKKLTKVANKRDTAEVLGWVQAVSNMLWWCCATCNESQVVWMTFLFPYCIVPEYVMQNLLCISAY